MRLSCNRAYYAAPIADFIAESGESVLGTLTNANQFDLTQTQRDAWTEQIKLLKKALSGLTGTVAFEFSIPRMGSRIDAVLLIEDVAFILEFKIRARTFDAFAIDQVTDYALDLHYFHEPSHRCRLVPVLIASAARESARTELREITDSLLSPTECCTSDDLRKLISHYVGASTDKIDAEQWLNGRYSPTPTIVEAASALYRGHSVKEISRSDTAGESLSKTSDAITRIIEGSRALGRKSICFVTGVPGAGKTLVGLNIANQHTDMESDLYSVFLSGNGPLVAVLREALTRDKVAQERQSGRTITKKEAGSQVKQFIQNVHHFRDACLDDPERPPIERVALFDEAQRAWNLFQTADFMARKKSRPEFGQSEPEFLISCLDRHSGWATVVCLVGGGQEINRGEGGIREWFEALKCFPDWQIHLAPELKSKEFDPGPALSQFEKEGRVAKDKALHLFASMRAFRAERVSELVGALLDFDLKTAHSALQACEGSYPILLTRNVEKARDWLREQARGTERTGIVVSSAAKRLCPHAINVKVPVDPVNWFLGGKDDVRSSFYLEDVATEFHIQGLELDWTCVTWDADFRYSPFGWEHFDFVGTKWNRIRSEDRQRYQKNAYRVLLTRARQGMIIVVPEGDYRDKTRLPELYDPTFDYLSSIGFKVI